MAVRKYFDTFLWMSLALFIASCQPSADHTAGDESTTADSREIRVITSGGFTAAYDILAPESEKATGIKLITSYGASSGGAPDSIPSRLSRGEAADIIILSRSSLDRLTDSGEVVPESRVDLVRSSIGLAVRSGAPAPDISTTESFVQALLAAESMDNFEDNDRRSPCRTQTDASTHQIQFLESVCGIFACFSCARLCTVVNCMQRAPSRHSFKNN